jgi:hypothetical protein
MKKKHLKRISAAKASEDAFAFVFLQVWAVVFTSILLGAFGFKD